VAVYCHKSKSGAWYYLAPEKITFWQWIKEIFIKTDYCSKDNSGEQLELKL